MLSFIYICIYVRGVCLGVSTVDAFLCRERGWGRFKRGSPARLLVGSVSTGMLEHQLSPHSCTAEQNLWIQSLLHKAKISKKKGWLPRFWRNAIAALYPKIVKLCSPLARKRPVKKNNRFRPLRENAGSCCERGISTVSLASARDVPLVHEWYSTGTSAGLVLRDLSMFFHPILRRYHYHIFGST